jgi:hypothetical protein
MPKYIKGLEGKTPPELSPDHSAIDAWFDDVVPKMQLIVRCADELIRDAIPGVQYALKRHRAHYGLPKHGLLIELAPYFKSVNILFYGGADFTSPPPLGETDRTRYLKITSVDELDSADLRGWLEEAARTPGWQ